jgi:predicted SAM-dependent methyltransferase
VKINFGCGRKVLAGFFNIDAVRNPAAPRDPELLYAAEFNGDGALKQKVPLDAGSANEVHAYHVIEHVYAWEAEALMAEWKRLLKPGGLLVLELPNIESAARNLLNGLSDQLHMWPFYGDPGHRDPYMCHRWGYTPHTIMNLLDRCGFVEIHMADPQTHGARKNRDMRVQATRP